MPDEHSRLTGGTPKEFSTVKALNVTYQYPSRHSPALVSVSVDLAVGQLAALIGHNGAGKTTFARCLLGQLRPTAGELLVDGGRLKSDQDWIASCAYIPQQPTMLDLTIRQYLTLGMYYSNEDVLSALNAVGAFWAADKFEERLGFTAHGGTQISLGQLQQLALARVLLRTEARLVVLDEPYSGLDPSSLRRTLQIYRELARTRVVIVIAHREDVVNISDYVVWFDNGSVRMKGCPDELKSQPEYHDFWQDYQLATQSTSR